MKNLKKLAAAVLAVTVSAATRQIRQTAQLRPRAKRKRPRESPTARMPIRTRQFM